MTISILGAEWEIIRLTEVEEPKLKDMDGYTDWTQRKIVVADVRAETDSLSDLEAYKRKATRHEIIHAFMCESGLDCNSNSTEAWAKNEEMIDFWAIQGPKIYKAWQEANAL